MNKSEFNNLNIKDQVQILNNKLKENTTISVTKLCKELGFNKSTIIDRFTKAGYKYNHDIRQYVIQNNNKSITSKSAENHTNSNQIIQKNNKNISNKVDVFKENTITGIKEDQLKGLLELLELKDQLKELIQNNIKSKNIIEVDLTELKVDTSKFEGEPVGRLIRVYKNVNDSWIKFCKENSQFKMQDLYSLALLEFIDKYSK